ncbi:MAG TPA: hypothetical protein P5524_00460 [Candidatus Paceibacterota bacterium]|nr:hypothetical protein [Candidatus Paceibacterota bacterium]
MIAIDWFVQLLPFAYLLITAGLILGLFKSKNLLRPAVIVVLILQTVKVGLLVFGQYYVWSHNPLSQGLLPPHTPLSYFIGYVGYRFVWPFALSLFIALLFYFVAKIINRRFQNRLFHEDEPGLIFYGIIVVGHPLWLFYVFAILLCAIVFYLLGLIFKKWKFGELFSLRYLWPIAAFLILVFGQTILSWPIINSLKF